MNGKVILIVFVLVMAFICFGLVQSATGQFAPNVTQGEEIGMVQPNGWTPGRDDQYAGGVNVPNSEANVNNAQANLINAQATLVVDVANQPTTGEVVAGSVKMFMIRAFLLVGFVIFIVVAALISGISQ